MHPPEGRLSQKERPNPTWGGVYTSGLDGGREKRPRCAREPQGRPRVPQGGPVRLRGRPTPGPPALPTPRRGRGPSGCSPPLPHASGLGPGPPSAGPAPFRPPPPPSPPGPAHRGRGPPGASRGCGQLTAAAPPGCTIRTHRRGGVGYSWRSVLGCSLAAQQEEEEERGEERRMVVMRRRPGGVLTPQPRW